MTRQDMIRHCHDIDKEWTMSLQDEDIVNCHDTEDTAMTR